MVERTSFGNPLVEQRTLLAGRGFVRLERAVFRVSGAEHLEWLHSFLTTDFKNLKPGVGREALLLSATGHIERVFHAVDDGEATLLITSADEDGKFVAWLKRMVLRSKVVVEVLTDEVQMLGGFGELSADAQVFGGQALAVWQDPWPNTVLGGARYAAAPVEPWKYFEAVLPGSIDLVELAAAESLNEVGTDALEALRIAAHRPSGVDIDDRSLPHEFDWLATAVHLSKGCYRGQETVAKVHNLGHPPRRLVMLHLDGSGHLLPEIGAEVSLGESVVGKVTSAAQHHEMGPIALALVTRRTDEAAELSVGGIAAAQELIVPASAGKAANIDAQRTLLMGKRG